MRSLESFQGAENLRPGDRCQFRYPAREEWLPGIVVKNGGYGYWHVLDDSHAEGRHGQITQGLYIEHVKAADDAT